MRSFLTLIILILLFVSLTVLPGEAAPTSYISEVSHAPVSPVVNFSVTFTAKLQSISQLSIDNLTLVVFTHNQTSRQTMDPQSTVLYQFITVFPQPGRVACQVELFANGLLIEISDQVIFRVDADENRQMAQLQYGKMHQLQAGNYSLNCGDHFFQLRLDLGTKTGIQVYRQSLALIDLPSDLIALSDLLQISINNSKAVLDAELEMTYNESILQQYAINPLTLQFIHRSSANETWDLINASTDITNQSISTQITQFSEWMVVATLPKLRFVAPVTEYVSSVDNYLILPLTIKNFGSLAATNITIRAILPHGGLLNNQTSIRLAQLGALEEYTINWQLYFEESGEFNVIVLVESHDSDGDLLQISVSINTSTAPSSSLVSNTNENPIFQQYWVTIVILGILISYRRKR